MSATVNDRHGSKVTAAMLPGDRCGFSARAPARGISLLLARVVPYGSSK